MRPILIGMTMLLIPSAIAQDRGSSSASSTTGTSEQDADDQESSRTQAVDTPTNYRGLRFAGASDGEASQRETGGNAVYSARPMARISNRISNRIQGRIQNRIQNRIRNRISQNYDPQANTTDPFAVAESESLLPVKPR